MNNPNEHENTPAAELMEQLVSLAVESCFHPSEEATKRLNDLKIEILSRISVVKGGACLFVPQEDFDKMVADAWANAPSPAEVKATTFHEEPKVTLHNGPAETAGADSSPKPAKRERSKS